MKSELIAKILAAKRLFVEADKPALEAMTEERLKAIAEELVKPPVVEEPKAAAAAPEELTREKVLALFPDIKAVVDDHTARVAARRKTLVEGLKVAAADAYSEAELAVMSIEGLEKLSRLITPKAAAGRILDFSGQAPAREADEDVPAAPKMGDRIRAARAAK